MDFVIDVIVVIIFCLFESIQPKFSELLAIIIVAK